MEKLSRQQILTSAKWADDHSNSGHSRSFSSCSLIPAQGYQLITALFFLLVAVTDTLDGYLARRRGMVTTLGKFLDPLADKLLIVATLIALIPARGIPAWMVIVIVGREIAVTGLRGIAVSQGIVISASTLGKYKTVFEVASISFLILDGELTLP